MCIGVPVKIITIDGEEAIGEYKGISIKVRIDLIENLKIGDYVMVHAGFAICIIDETIEI